MFWPLAEAAQAGWEMLRAHLLQAGSLPAGLAAARLTLGVTAAATTAVLATGAPMTPTLPTRAGLRGISISCGYGCRVGLIEAMIA